LSFLQQGDDFIKLFYPSLTFQINKLEHFCLEMFINLILLGKEPYLRVKKLLLPI
jgi:hypothetical protein